MFKIIDEGPVFTGAFLGVNEVEVIHNNRNTFKREIVRKDSASIIAPIKDSRILLVGQYRASIDKFCYELPAGHIDPGESPLEAARRELLEETGLYASCWSFMSSCYSSLGWTDEKNHYYLAQELTYTDDVIERAHEESEMVYEWFPLTEAVRYAMLGHFYGTKTNLGVMLAANTLGYVELNF